MTTDISICVTLSRDEAIALAQLVKRFTYEDAARRAFGERELNAMLDAILRLQTALDAAGISPR